jgi:hypothetical protein
MSEPKRLPGWVVVIALLLFVAAAGLVIVLSTRR